MPTLKKVVLQIWATEVVRIMIKIEEDSDRFMSDTFASVDSYEE